MEWLYIVLGIIGLLVIIIIVKTLLFKDKTNLNQAIEKEVDDKVVNELCTLIKYKTISHQDNTLTDFTVFQDYINKVKEKIIKSITDAGGKYNEKTGELKDKHGNMVDYMNGTPMETKVKVDTKSAEQSINAIQKKINSLYGQDYPKSFENKWNILNIYCLIFSFFRSCYRFLLYYIWDSTI